MDTLKRLTRRPAAFLLWAALLAATAMILSAGCALWYSAVALYRDFDDLNATVALRPDRPTEGTKLESGMMWASGGDHLYQADVDTLSGMDSVRGVYFHTLTGAYSPSLSPVLGLRGSEDAVPGVNGPYTRAAILATVEEVLSDEARDPGFSGAPVLEALGLTADAPLRDVWVLVRVDEVVEAHPGLGIEPGLEVACLFTLAGAQARDVLHTSGQYLIAGDYIIGSRRGSCPVLSQSGAVCAMEGGGLMRHDLTLGPDRDTGELTVISDTSLPAALPPDMAGDAVWAGFVSSIREQNRSVPVLGTDCLRSMYMFVSDGASIVEGRDFTPEEYASGARVCVMSETLAAASGLRVGDAVELSQFLTGDESSNPSLTFDVDGKLNNPTVGGFDAAREYAVSGEPFTIVGLYRQLNEWSDDSWAVTPNTVFIPKKAQIPGGFGGPDAPEGQGGSFGVYLSVLLRNGYRERFREELEAAGLQGGFVTFDQDFDSLVGVMRSVTSAARSHVAMTLGGFLALFLLYLLIYQGSQRRNVGIMRSLGAGVRASGRYLFVSGLVPALTGFALGLIGAALSMSHLDKYLTSQMAGLMDAERLSELISGSRMPAYLLVLLATAETILAAAVLRLHAAGMAKRPPRRLLGV